MDALTAFKSDLTRYLRGRLTTVGDVQVAGEYPPGLRKRTQRRSEEHTSELQSP